MPMSFPNPSLIGYSMSNNTRPLVGLTSTVILDANPERLYAEIRNNTTQQMWIAKGIPAVVGQGTRINPGAIRMFTDNELYLGQFNAITIGSPNNIEVEEGIE